MVSSGVLGFCQPCVGRSKQTPRVNGTNQGGAGQKSPDWRQVGAWIATRQFLGEVWVVVRRAHRLAAERGRGRRAALQPRAERANQVAEDRRLAEDRHRAQAAHAASRVMRPPPQLSPCFGLEPGGEGFRYQSEADPLV